MIWKTCRGEMLKQRRNYFNTWSTYISLLLWPMITFIGSFFSYKNFDIYILKDIGISSASELAIFLLTGFLGYNTFWVMVQSALFMHSERENGTLEVVFLTPASRIGIIYGRAMGALFQGVWVLILYSIMVMMIDTDQIIKIILALPIVFFVIIVSAVIWGGFINSIFLISRDVDFWFAVCDEPMKLFSGVELPTNIIPVSLQILSAFFPLTYCLNIIRKVILSEVVLIDEVIMYLMSNFIIVLVTIVILKKAEKNNRETGNLERY